MINRVRIVFLMLLALTVVQTAWGQLVPVPAALGGKLVDITVGQGQKVLKGQPIGWLERDVK